MKNILRIVILITICIVVVINSSNIDDAEKVMKVWEDRVQHADLDADEVNFPYFLKDTLGDLPSEEVTEHVDADTINNDDTNLSDDLSPEYVHLNTHSNSSMFTFYHSITSNNVTRQGVTTVSSSSLLPFLKQALSSVSEESALLLAVGGLLPMLMISLPMMMMTVMVPVLLMMAVASFGLLASLVMFLPLIIFGFIMFAVTDVGMEYMDYAFDSFDKTFESFPELEEIEKIDNIINIDVENITKVEDNSSFQVQNNNFPRYLY